MIYFIVLSVIYYVSSYFALVLKEVILIFAITHRKGYTYMYDYLIFLFFHRDNTCMWVRLVLLTYFRQILNWHYLPFSFLSYTNFSLLLLLLLLLQTLLLLLKLFDCLNSINKLRKFFLKKIWYRLRINYLEVAISPLTFFFSLMIFYDEDGLYF